MKPLKLVMTLCVVLLASIFLMQSTASAASCCTGIRGNVDGDVEELVDISDLVYLVDFMFTSGPAPVCLDEGNIDADIANLIDISDLVYLVDFMFTSGPAPADCPASDEVVFVDEYGSGVTYFAFDGSKLDAVQLDAINMYAGTQGLEITIPGAAPWWSGGAFVDTSDSYAGRDLTEFNALTFWAKSSIDATLDVMGLGNDNSGNSLYTAEMTNIPLTTSWQKYIIPIPLAEKLTAEAGLFYFAEGEGVEYQISIDEIIFENLGTITNPRPALTPATIDVALGETVAPGNGSVIFDVDGTDVTISAMPGYFTFSSDDELVVSVGLDGVITAVGVGTATLTADLGTTAATGSITVNVTSPEAVPAGPAPTPTVSAIDVVSLYSDVYTNVPVGSWSAGWDVADVADYVIGSDSTKKYTNLDYAGILFESPTVDASAMSHFHIDVWTPNPTAAPAAFKVKLVSFGADGAWGGGDDTEHELVFDENTMSSENWVSIDVPLASFSNLAETAHLAQMVISSQLSIPTVYVDNIYFYDAGLPTEPLVPAPTPTQDAGNVFSVFSDIYTSTVFDVWSPVWDGGDVVGFNIGSDNIQKYILSSGWVLSEYSDGVTGSQDISTMTHMHVDVWTPDVTDVSSQLLIKLVDFGADGVSTGTDNTEHELTFDNATMSTGSWVSLDIPLADFSGMDNTGHFAQMILSGTYGTLFIDNLYFYNASAPTAPTTSAPTPTEGSGTVISLYSNAYTNESMAFWSPTYAGQGWDDGANVYDQTIGSDDIMEFEFFGGYSISEASPVLDIASMTYMHIDVWTPEDPTGKLFNIKLVDYGPNGTYDGGDDTFHELAFNDATMTSGSWVSLDIPMSDFTGLTTRNAFAQLVLSGTYGIVFVDNVYFHN